MRQLGACAGPEHLIFLLAVSASARLFAAAACVAVAAVAQGLESLAKQELNWDPVQLSAGLPLLGDPLDPQDKLVSKEQYSNLIAAGFRNYLEVRAASKAACAVFCTGETSATQSRFVACSAHSLGQAGWVGTSMMCILVLHTCLSYSIWKVAPAAV
jgi:hypothetical protein